MKGLALIALLVGAACAMDLKAGGGNYVRVENGQVVEYDFAKSLNSPQMRNGDGSTGGDNVFNGNISIIDALNPNSPFSQWIDDLLNPNSDPYVQAVVNALKILLAIMLAALAPLGINNFTILILGFAPGSVTVEYELAIDNNEWDAAGQPSDGAILSNIVNEIDNNGDQIEGVTINNQKTTLSGADGTTTQSSCPGPCWIVEAGFCVPNPDNLALTCDASGMSLAVDYCVMGDVPLADLTMNGNCNAASSNIIDNGSRYVATSALDGCSSTMNYNSSQLTFANFLEGLGNTDPNAVINLNARYKVDFSCSYSTTYNNIDSTTQVESNIINGDHDGSGQFGFQINTYTDNTFTTEDTSGTVQIGTTLNFGVAMSQVINGVVFTTTDCTVSSELGLDYQILTDRCPNTHVGFSIIDNFSGSMNQFSYSVFEFKAEPGSDLNLSCNIVVCAADATDSTCAEAVSCARRRKRRAAIGEGVTYYRVSKALRAI